MDVSRSGSSQALRVLSITPFPPRLDAAHGGAKVVGQLLARTAERHHVAVFALRHPGEPPVDDELRARLGAVEEVDRPPDDEPLVRMRVRASLLRARPAWPTQLRVPGAIGRLRELAARWRPDVVRLEYAAMAYYATAVRGVPRILVLYDPPVEAAQNRAAVFGGRLGGLEVRAWRRYERRALAGSDAVVVLTDRDRERIGPAVGRARLTTIPLGVEIPTHPLDARGTERQSILFVANFLHAPNVDAAKHLARDLFPRIRAEHPGSRLYLVGGSPPREAAGDGVVATGQVADVEDYLDRAAVVVAPLRLGGGMRVKVLEALAAGKALVAYPAAVTGLELENGVHAFVAHDANAFADGVAALLADPRLRKALGDAARAWALEHLGWDGVLDAYDRLYRELLGEAQSAPAENDHPDVADDPAETEASPASRPVDPSA